MHDASGFDIERFLFRVGRRADGLAACRQGSRAVQRRGVCSVLTWVTQLIEQRRQPWDSGGRHTAWDPQGTGAAHGRLPTAPRPAQRARGGGSGGSTEGLIKTHKVCTRNLGRAAGKSGPRSRCRAAPARPRAPAARLVGLRLRRPAGDPAFSLARAFGALQAVADREPWHGRPGQSLLPGNECCSSCEAALASWEQSAAPQSRPAMVQLTSAKLSSEHTCGRALVGSAAEECVRLLPHGALRRRAHAWRRVWWSMQLGLGCGGWATAQHREHQAAGWWPAGHLRARVTAPKASEARRESVKAFGQTSVCHACRGASARGCQRATRVAAAGQE
jgi:hypothetical protein